MVALGRVRWWHWLPRRRWRIVASVPAADEVPAHLPRHGVVIVGDVTHCKWIAFDCPCRARHRIMLNSDANRRPRWLIARQSPLSLYPSIDAFGSNGRCHYIIRDGNLRWVPDDEE
jgi:hypothetical protein